jgi:hypothetical protein
MHRKNIGRPPHRLGRKQQASIVTLEGAPGSAVIGAGIAGQVKHLEGVVAVRDRFTYPDPSAPSAPSDPGLWSRTLRPQRL